MNADVQNLRSALKNTETCFNTGVSMEQLILIPFEMNFGKRSYISNKVMDLQPRKWEDFH